MNQPSTIFQTTERVYVWRKPTEAFSPDSLLPTVKHEGLLMIWGAVSWHGLGPLVILHGKITAAYYVDIMLGDQVHPFLYTLFPRECPLYQEDNFSIHTAKIV